MFTLNTASMISDRIFSKILYSFSLLIFSYRLRRRRRGSVTKPYFKGLGSNNALCGWDEWRHGKS